MAKKFSISNTTLKSLSKLNVTTLIITTKCVAGFLSVHTDHLFKKDGDLMEQVINKINSYKPKAIYTVNVMVEKELSNHYIFDLLACYPNGKVAHMAGDLLTVLPDSTIRNQFKNADEILNYKLHDLPFSLPKVEAMLEK